MSENGTGPPPMPRWVKLLALTILAIVVLTVLLMVVSGGEHGPGRHGALGSDAAIAFIAARSA